MGRKRWLVLAAAVSVAVAVSRPAAGILVDMAGHWSSPVVGALQARGIVSGDDTGRFDPDGPLTRAQLAKLMVTSLGFETDARLLAGYGSRFVDISGWHWAKGYVEVLSETGVVEGYPDGSFRPEEPVTRAQLAAILARVAGLVDQARLMRFEQTKFTDDTAIPAWSRGFINVAQAFGLLTGFDDGSYRPEQPITRAESSVALFRVLTMKGQIFDLTGTLTRFDPTIGEGVVRDRRGVDHAFRMAANAEYFRAGLPSSPLQVKPLDQVWIVLGPDNSGTFLDARFDGRLALNLTSKPGQVSVTLVNGPTESFAVQPGALVFLNGEKATLEQVNGVHAAYLVLDRESGDVRVLDAMTPQFRGRTTGIDAGRNALIVQSETELASLRLSTDVTILLNGRTAVLSDLTIGDEIRTVADNAGQFILVLATR